MINGETKEETLARVAKEQAKFDDWRGTCSKCKQIIKGTVQKIMTHKCLESGGE